MKLSLKKRQQLLQKLAVNEAVKKVRALCFSETQKNILDDTTSQIVLCSTRRASKSFTAVMLMFIRSLQKSHSICGIAGLTLSTIKRIVLNDAAAKIIRLCEIHDVVRIVGSEVRFVNGSVIYIFGADKKESMSRMRGLGYDVFVLDECQSFVSDIKQTIIDVVKIASSGRRGIIILTGTPGDVMTTWFHDVCNDIVAGWSAFYMHWRDNPYERDGIQQEIDNEVAINPDFLESNTYKREYEGIWVSNTVWTVYGYNPEKNCDIDVLPPYDDWKYVLGVDLGFSPDPSAMVVQCYSSKSPNLYIVKAELFPELDFNQLSEKISEWNKLFKFSWRVIDGANKQGIVTISNKLGFQWEPNNKLGKKAHIEMFNVDLSRSWVKLLPSVRGLLCPEWNNLVWDRKAFESSELAKRVWKELPSCPNHLSDANLYAYMAARNFRYKPPDVVEQKKQSNLSRFSNHMTAAVSSFQKRPSMNELRPSHDNKRNNLSQFRNR